MGHWNPAGALGGPGEPHLGRTAEARAELDAALAAFRGLLGEAEDSGAAGLVEGAEADRRVLGG